MKKMVCKITQNLADHQRGIINLSFSRDTYTSLVIYLIKGLL